MSLFRRIKEKFATSSHRPDLSFGRFNERKSEAQFKAWEQALFDFKEDRFLDAVERTLIYLSSEQIENCSWTVKPHLIEFNFIQGSQQINGWANPYEIHAEACLGHIEQPSNELMEHLLELNYGLTYSKYCLRDAAIIVKFSSSHLDGSPYKVYEGLRELAMQADKQDDLALERYEQFNPDFSKTLRPHLPKVVDAMSDYVTSQIQSFHNDYVSCKLDKDEFAGAYAHLILAYAYRLDYLLRPEAGLKESLEEIHNCYQNQEVPLVKSTNEQQKAALMKFEGKNRDYWKSELYQVMETFGFTGPVSRERMGAFITEEIDKMDWYYRENHPRMAASIPDFIVGYGLFNYALPKPFQVFFQLYYEVFEGEFFQSLGFTPRLATDNDLNKKLIAQRIDQIIKELKQEYPKISLDIKSMRFDNSFYFAKSYLLALAKLSW